MIIFIILISDIILATIFEKWAELWVPVSMQNQIPD